MTLSAQSAPKHMTEPVHTTDDSFWCYAHNNNPTLYREMPLTIFVTTHRRYNQLVTLIFSLKSQTETNFHLVVLHDGPDIEMQGLLTKMSQEIGLSFEFRFSKNHYKDYGHSLRAEAIQSCETEYMLLTNDDNYYVPVFVELMLAAAKKDNLDMVLCDMVHNHNMPGGRSVGSYSAFPTHPSMCNVDMGCFITRTERAKRVGFRDKSYIGDGTFVEDLIALGPDLMRWGKVEKILFVHN